jgi:hypothetical protein
MSNDSSLPSDPSAPPRAGEFDWSLVTGALLVWVMLSPVLVGRIYTFDDLGDFHLPLRVFYSEQLAQGESFLWTPQLFCGYYVAGEGQAGMFHPWHLLLYSVLPVSLAFAFEVVGSYPFMFAGTFFFLRRRLNRRQPALFGGLLFTFCSFNLLHFIHVNAIAVVAHIPWLLWATDVWFFDGNRRRAIAAQVAVALLTGSQLLLGSPQFVWFSLLAEAAFVLFLVLDRQDPVAERAVQRAVALRRAVGWALAKAAGVLIGGIQLLTTLDVLRESVRQSATADYTNLDSLFPLNLVQFVAPYLFSTRVFGRNTHELSVYLGAVPLMLVVWLLCQRWQWGVLRRFNGFFAALGLVAFWLALGKFGLLYGLQRWLPIVGNFRCPCRYVVLVQFAVTVLAAVAFLLLLRQRERKEPASWAELKPLAIPVVLSLVAVLAPWVFPNANVFGPRRLVLLGPVLIAAAALLVALVARGVRWAPVMLILFAAADLGFYGFSYAVFPRTIPVSQLTDKVPVPPGWPDGRVLMNPERIGERGVHFGNGVLLADWARADGYAALEPARQLDYHCIPALRVANVRWVMKNKLTTGLSGLLAQGDWLQVPDPLPRVYLVTQARPSSRPAEEITKIAVETTALVESPLDLPAGAPGRATLYNNRPGRLEVWVDCPTPQLLVVSQRYHAGWQALVEGSPREVLRVNGDFMGCVVQPGEHRVQLAFRPRSVRDGAIVSCLGLALAGSFFLGLRSRRRRE